MFEELIQKLDDFIGMGVPFCDCAVMKDGEYIFRRSVGYTDLEKTKPITGKEIYNIYSCSKLITCVAALQLWEKGYFDLDDELCKYMPEFEIMKVKTEDGIKTAQNKITIRHLFTMTAGFGYDIKSTEIKKCQVATNGECQTRELMEYLAKEPLLFEPGYRWEYSLCHDVLAALVEVISGSLFSDYVKQNFFDICRMENSSFAVYENNIDSICSQYKFDENRNEVSECAKTNEFKLGTKYESGGAGCISSVDDYLKFLEAIRTYKILKKVTVDLLSSNQLTEKQINMPTYWLGKTYGFGLGVRCPWKKSRVTDMGWGGTAGAHYFIDRTRNICVYLGAHITESIRNPVHNLRAQALPGKSVYCGVTSADFGIFRYAGLESSGFYLQRQLRLLHQAERR